MNSRATRATGLDNLARELKGYADTYERLMLADDVDPHLANLYRNVIKSLRIQVDDIRIQADVIRREAQD